jgi:hypothetical protein
MRLLRGILLSAVALVLAGQAGAASFAVTDYALGHRVSYVLNGESGRNWTAQLKATLDGALGTSFCVDLKQSIGLGSFEGEVYDPSDLGAYDYLSAAAIAHAWANQLGKLAGQLGVGRRDAITGVQLAIWQTLYDNALVVDRARLGSEHPGSLIALDFVSGGDLSGLGGEKVVLFRRKQDQVFTPSVPEPSALLCFGAGGLVIGAALRRKR